MANKRPKPEEIVSKLRQVEVLMGQGMSRLDAIRQIGVVDQTYYRWRKQYGGMGVDQLKELKRLQSVVRQSLTRLKAPQSHKSMKRRFETTP